jgi:tight adherence protein C
VVLVLLLALVCLAGAVYAVGQLVSLPARERALSLRRATSFGRVVKPEDADARERLLVPIVERLSALVLRLHPSSTVEAVDRRLLAAGLGRTLTAQTFLALKVVLTAAGAVFGLAVGGGLSGAKLALLFCILGATLGWMGPGAVVGRMGRNRSDRIARDLPNALDLLAVSVEAGLGFDGAVAKMTERMEGPLGDEFSLVLAEMRIGESREQALRSMADRVTAPELAQFARAIIQADQLGTSLGRILRVQATDTRNRRQAAVEEKAAKTPIKMLFPTVLFIFPAMFIVVLGSAFLNIGTIFDL